MNKSRPEFSSSFLNFWLFLAVKIFPPFNFFGLKAFPLNHENLSSFP